MAGFAFLGEHPFAAERHLTIRMRTVRQRLTNEIDYLRALAEIYKGEDDAQALQSTLAAIAALDHLVEIINAGEIEGPDMAPFAA